MTRLADLHLHLYGGIQARDYLEYVSDRPVDWSPYEAAYAQAYGAETPARDLLRRHLESEGCKVSPPATATRVWRQH